MTNPTEKTSTTPSLEVADWAAGTWKLDPVHSHIGFSVKHMMVSKVRGHVSNVSATIVTTDDPLQSSVTAALDATSLTTGNETRNGHLASADFFDVEHHPNWTFESDGVRINEGTWLIDGTLTIRGISKPVTLVADPPAFGAGNSSDAKKLGISASTVINRLDFNVSYNGPVPGGGVVIGDSIEITLDIEADLVP